MDYGYNPTMYMNPYNNITYPTYRPQNTNALPIQGEQLNKANGIDSVRAYPTKPNSTIAIFDANEDVFYIKSTDVNNFPTIRRFRFYEESEQPKTSQADGLYVTKEEFDKFKEEVLNDQQFVRNNKSNGKYKSNEQHQSDKKSDGNSTK